ncbi:MAG: alkaline phosphatase family protein [Christensenellales bacterium]|jgi:predicted AlkP superfamily pyrophosphatase or phosphodiesterase
MIEKVVLVLVDGMRPDGLMQCGHPFLTTLLKDATYALDAQTVMPSVTLPCHMSLFHSVDPQRHGILSNTYTPQVRPIPGLIEQLDMYGKKCAMFITWEELRDLSRPDHLHRALCINQHKTENADRQISDAAIQYIKEEQPDFLFLYLGNTDEDGGHDTGWMSETYLQVVNKAIACIEDVYKNLPKGYNLIVCSDHGGHDRMHGHDIPEDMTIPIIFCGPRFKKNTSLSGVSIKDIAPTIAKLLDIPFAREWEGIPRA